MENIQNKSALIPSDEIRSEDVYKRQDALFTELGMNLTTAFNIFVRQSLREGGIPFEVRLSLIHI